ncbi:SGT1-domain-containing protein [Choiromyces venosus 120613-1]|uniref:SGT1-domain-containing protein n=1 Tax=Choiromyces venosus 120613-1 TaxID=1336337 RepID=A0A3N4J5M5_9PEZI|nr:SGT1-domain-containing protein [Choiromyces venosus 120613-1]
MEASTEDPFTTGFGQFQGIPQRTLPDDCMEYTLIIIDRAADQDVIRTELEKVKQTAAKFVKGVAADYIWQRDSFQLELAKTEGVGWHLRGRTEYGDSVDDEWLIVWILRELSRKIPNLWLSRVYDTDGEFLLIEAASTLPRWLNPEIADNRVWIHGANLLIIPTDRTKPAACPLTLKEAHSVLSSDNSTPLQRIRLVEEEAFYRLGRYPKAIQEHLHYAEVLVPRTCAMVLHEAPESIAAAVEAFYLRDPISLKSLKSMSHFPPSDMVTISAKFTKVLYAQLVSQEFEPPTGSGFKFSPDMPNANTIGMKLACGFEMLISDDAAPQISSEARKNMVTKVKDILQKNALPTDAEISSWPRQIDGEDWLNINYEELDRNLSGKNADPPGGSRGTNTESGWGDKQAEETLKKMVKRFEAFLNDEDAGVEGAEVDDMDIDDDDSDDDDDAELDDSDEDKEISFDEVEFSRMMREMMGMPTQTADGDEGEGEDEETKIREVMAKVEEELKEAGAIERGKGMAKIHELHGEEDESDGDDGDGEVNIDYTLARNMLESLKGQAGLSGPGGNLLARMGIVLPRDEPEEEGGKNNEAKGKQIQS